MPTPNVYGDLRQRCKDKSHYQRCCRLIRRGMELEAAFELSLNRGDGLTREQRKNSVIIKCDQCGKKVEKEPNALRGHTHHFCSPACRDAFRRKNIPIVPKERFKEIYDYVQPYLSGIFYRVCRKYQVTGRVTWQEYEQEVIICIYKHAHYVRTDEDDKRAFWCANIAWSFAAYILKYVFNKRGSIYLLPLFDNTTPWDRCSALEIAKFLDQADDYKMLLKWSFERTTTEELCKEYGCNAHALGLRLSRARARLAEDLRDY